MWKYFKRSRDNKLAKCLNCGKEYKTSGNTSNLQDHLKRFHPTVSQSESDCSSDGNSLSGSSTSGSLRSISPFFKRALHYDESSQKKKEIDKALTFMIAKDFQPFNIVNDTGFKQLLNIIDPKYVIPSKTTVRDNYMKEYYLSAKNKLKDMLMDTSYVAITTDSWTSRQTECYLTVTCHFVTHDFQLKNVILSTKPLGNGQSHSSENIANALKEIFVEWSIEDKVTCIVTDNANNMLKACEILKKRNMPCYAHTLNLVVQDSLKLECISPVIEKCKTIVRHFKSSAIAMDIFKKAQNIPRPLSLIQEVATRWNSSFAMIKRILDTVDPLGASILKLKKPPQPLSVDEIALLREIVKILQLFEEATKQISGEKFVTISLLIPITNGLYNEVVNMRETLESQESKIFCDNILDSIKKRLFPYETRTVAKIATMLDPRFKKEGFKCIDNANHTSQLLENEMSYMIKNTVNYFSPQTVTASSDRTQSSEHISLFKFLENKLSEKTKSTLADVIIIKRQYLERPNASQDTDPLLFWKVSFCVSLLLVDYLIFVF